MKELGYKDANYFFHGLAAADWYRGYQYCTDLVAPSKRKLKKKYITFNRITGNSRAYRSLLIAELSKNNLLNQGYISYSELCPVHGPYEENILAMVGKYKISAEYIIKTRYILDRIQYPLRIDCTGMIPNGSQTIGPINALIESFLHVVTETCFWDDRTHLTEKIFKPIVARQPFVLLGCAGNLQYLQSYGFKTFDNWWDESYDHITDPILRLQKVVDLIKDICSMDIIELENILRGMKYTLDYNYELFYSKDFINSIWSEMTTSLQSAISQLSPPISLRI